VHYRGDGAAVPFGFRFGFSTTTRGTSPGSMLGTIETPGAVASLQAQ
jgi:hypothetical protein